MPDQEYLPSSTVLCFENFKQSALYFDRVIPLNMSRMRGDPDVGDILMGYPEEIPSAALSHLIDGVEGNTKTYSHANRVMDVCIEKWGNLARELTPYARLWTRESEVENEEEAEREIKRQYRKLQTAYFENASCEGSLPVRQIFRDYATGMGFDRFCVIGPPSESCSNNQTDQSITLSQLSLIDTSEAGWKQIIEVRKDFQSHRKLSRLRLFMHNNYNGRSFAYIEDDLSRRIEEYYQVTKKFGFKTASSSISMLLDSKALQTSVGAGLIAGLFGGSLAGLSAAATVEIGRIAINVAERRHEMKDWQAGHDLAYIFETQQRFS
jgi:hypothetical protein